MGECALLTSADRRALAYLAARNAVNYTPDGGRLEVRLEADDHAATLVVTDTGMGIPESEQGRLFTRFFRSTTATEQAVQGPAWASPSSSPS